MQLKDLAESWTRDEIRKQTNLISEIEKSGMQKLKGVSEFLSMRKQFLSIAKETLDLIKTGQAIDQSTIK